MDIRELPGRLRKIRVPFVVVFALLFLILAVGILLISGMDGDIRRLMATVSESGYALAMKQKEVLDLASRLELVQSDAFVASEARSKYGYLADGEIRFVVANPQVLFEDAGLVSEGENPP